MKLTELEKNVWKLVWIYGQSLDTIARDLNRPYGDVKKALNRAAKKVKATLGI